MRGAVQACPGCGREYTNAGKLCPCGYAQRAVRFAERDTAPPAGYLEWCHQERRAREQREQAWEQAKIDRRIREQLAQDARDREAAQAERNRRAAERRERKRAARPKPKPKPYEPPEARRPPDPREVRRSWNRIALTRMLDRESTFLEQRNESAHRAFLKILERVAPPEEFIGWREPLELGWRNAHRRSPHAD
jgi:hypothetical protein